MKKILRLISSTIIGVIFFGWSTFTDISSLFDLIVHAYDFNAAVDYAHTYWSNYNPNYSNYNSIGGDCANFVSQCLIAGGLEMTDNWFWYSYDNRSASWASCPSMYNCFANMGYEIIENPSDDLVIEGNPVLYYSSSKGRWSHAAICTGHDSNGNALVSAHNTDRCDVNWRLGNGWSKRCTIIIADSHECYDHELDIPYCRPGNLLLRNGSKGHYVGWLQTALERLGYDVGGVDCDFGRNTENAVTAFQSDYGIEVDGIVGVETINKIVEKVQEILSNNNPVGYLDSVTGGEKSIIVNGWAYDADTPEEPCEIHIYMDGPAGQGICVATGIIANLPSPDVYEILGYPGNHRYEATIPIDAVGEHTFYAHAINRGGGEVNSLLEGSYTATINDVPVGSEMLSGAGQTISDGDYAIFSAIYPDLYLDIYGVDLPAADGTNVIIHTHDVYSLPDSIDCWTVEYLNNGFYKIRQKGTTACLDVAGADPHRGTNVQVHSDNGSTAQQWSIQPTDHGYIIQSRCNSFYLNVYGGHREDLSNVQVWENDGTKAQYFCFIPIGNDNDRIIEDGEYVIKFAKDKNFIVDCNGTPEEGYAEGTNVTLWNAEESKDIFQVTYTGDGYYKIAEKTTGYVLDITFGFHDNDTQNYLDKFRNIALFKDYNSRNQRWMIKSNGDGSYSIISQFTGYCLDNYGGYPENGTNIAQHYINGSDAQKWILVPADAAFVQGDCNNDEIFDITDIVLLKKWLLTVPDTHLANWKSADLNTDGKLNGFDLALMRRLLLETA